MFVLVALIILVAGIWVYGRYAFETKPTTLDDAIPTPVKSTMSVPGGNVPEMVVGGNPAIVAVVKEFTMTAYYDEKGKWFSLKEMTVKKGDTVRVSVTNTKGMHNFNIDELGVAKDLPLNEVVVVEFAANKAGDFVYYCSIPGHRAGGQWGTLHVTE